MANANHQVWVLGAGQLGAMMRHAGMPLAIEVYPVPLDSDTIPAVPPNAVVTPEIEHWPQTPANQALANHPNFMNAHVFDRLADRLTQKQLIDHLNLATAPWCNVTTESTADNLFALLGDRVLLKRRRGGYDGRGQHWLEQPHATTIPDAWIGEGIAEAAIDFNEELSLVGVRDRNGQHYFYPLTLNLHTDGILTASLAPLARLAPLQAQAESMLGALLDELDYIGVMAMECFRVGDKLLINELAPRVHNSGHWTQAGTACSQFESHLRAVTGLPLAPPKPRGLTAMINLVGVDRNNQWLAIPEAALYWYGKEVRPGRKVGHINLCGTDPEQVIKALEHLKPLLPERYEAIIHWAQTRIAAGRQ